MGYIQQMSADEIAKEFYFIIFEGEIGQAMSEIMTEAEKSIVEDWLSRKDFSLDMAMITKNPEKLGVPSDIIPGGRRTIIPWAIKNAEKVMAANPAMTSFYIHRELLNFVFERALKRLHRERGSGDNVLQ